MRWGGELKIPLQEFALKMQGGLCVMGDVFAAHYGIHIHICVCE